MKATASQDRTHARGIMLAIHCPHGHDPEVIRVPAEGDETALDVYFRVTRTLQSEGVIPPLHYRPYGFDN